MHPRRQKKINDAKDRMDAMATRLANELGIETLETRNLDSLDFHEVSVASLKRVLQRAFVLGMRAHESERPNIKHFVDAL